MTLQLKYKDQTNVPVEVEGITPDAVCGKSLAEIEKCEIFHGNQPLALAEFFAVFGDPSDREIRWEGSLSGVHWIGARMSQGRIHVLGSVGRHVGSEMTGGEILVEGDAGDWVGGEMHGGLIRIRGNAGQLVGAGYRGSVKGMTGGVILVEGSAGNEIGHSMRRGLIAIGGNLGDLAGINMLAGTILTFGESGIRVGAGMKRGTIGLLGKTSPPLLPTFRRACRIRPEVFSLIFAELRRHGFPFPDDLWGAELELFSGDLIEGGRGEIWIRPQDSKVMMTAAASSKSAGCRYSEPACTS